MRKRLIASHAIALAVGAIAAMSASDWFWCVVAGTHCDFL